MNSTQSSSELSIYYQAHVDRAKSWFVVAVLKSFDHLAFDRTIDPANSIFEFFVTPAMEEQFLVVMERLAKRGLIQELKKLPNRFANI